MLEEARTIGMPASGKFCISVGSHVSKSSWNSDAGTQVDHQSVLRRSSPFSSVGPTRDGRWKPEISAPGQYITAALSDLSDLSQWDERAQENQRLATIEGTSMAAPVVAGAVALMLQKEPTLTTEKIRDLLERTASRDMYTGPSRWTDVYGFGKPDIVKALAEL